MDRKVAEEEGGGGGRGEEEEEGEEGGTVRRKVPLLASHWLGGFPKKRVLLTNFSLLRHSPAAAPGTGDLSWKAEATQKKLTAGAVSKPLSMELGSGFFWKGNLAVHLCVFHSLFVAQGASSSHRFGEQPFLGSDGPLILIGNRRRRLVGQTTAPVAAAGDKTPSGTHHLLP